MTESARNIYALPSRAIAARILGGEMMVMSVRDSTFFTLNEIATIIWRASDGQTSLHDITRAMCEEFDVDFETAYRDVEDLVSRLSEHGIISVSDQPISSALEGANKPL
jgi:hypothetical protein